MARVQEVRAVKWLSAALCSAALCSAALCVACRGEDWIIGGELPRDVGSPSGVGDGPTLVSDPAACPSSIEVLGQREQAFGAASVAMDYVGRWRAVLGVGAAEGFPSRDVALEIDASGAGTLLFDALASDRLPDDVDEGYLCSAEASGVVCGSASGFVGGFAYPIGAARSRDGVLSFVIVTADPWGSWCAEREPVSWDDPRQLCGVSFGVLPAAMQRYSALGCSRITEEEAQEIDCALMYALEHCQCARDACFARFDRSVEVGLELSQDGTALVGRLWYDSGLDAAPVLFSREQ
jgi:hypothetical protein